MKNALIPFRKRSMRSSREWDYTPFARLSQEIDDLLNTYYGRGYAPLPRMQDEFGIELSESDDDIQVRADLPGMKENDIQISLEGDFLTIKASRKEQKEKRKRNYHISEMSYGGVSRTIQLPAQIDCEKASAKFKRGVLTLHLPKTEQSKHDHKRIPVTTE